jgi:hypothetical protein
MIVSRTHLRALDRISDLRRQIVDPVDTALIADSVIYG